MGEVKHTPKQMNALRWLADNRCHSAGWMRNGKPAYGSPETWNQHEMRSDDSSLVVDADDHFAIRDFVASAAEPGVLYSLNEAGRAALAKAEASPNA